MNEHERQGHIVPEQMVPYSPENTIRKSNTSIIIILIIVIILIAGGWYLYSSSQEKLATTNTPISQVLNDTQNPIVPSDADLRIPYVPISSSNNSAQTFNAVKTDSITKADSDFLSKYFGSFSSKNLPPVAQSQKILTTHADLLKIFDANANKPYQCSIAMGESCFLQPVRNIVSLAALRAVTSFQQNKSTEAQTTASNIIGLGKSITANLDDTITLLMGWTTQKLGYSILLMVHPKNTSPQFSDSEKTNLIATLQQEQKKSIQYGYTRSIEIIDYITSPNNKPSIVVDADGEDLVKIYRDGIVASPSAWNPTETKKYFYDSYKIALSNIDLPCGTTPQKSTQDLNFDPNNQQIENFMGKTLYTTTYASLDTLSTKRCEIESLIHNL